MAMDIVHLPTCEVRKGYTVDCGFVIFDRATGYVIYNRASRSVNNDEATVHSVTFAHLARTEMDYVHCHSGKRIFGDGVVVARLRVPSTPRLTCLTCVAALDYILHELPQPLVVVYPWNL